MKLSNLFLAAATGFASETRPDWMLPKDWAFCMASTQIDLRSRGPGGFADRIVGGGPAEIGTWPFMVRFQFGRNYLCGGALLDGKTVLTAAHCCFGYRYSDYLIFINDHHLFKQNDGNIRVQATSVEYHKSFSWLTFKNDLCIFKLEDDVSQEIGMSSFPCLPPKGYEFEPGTKCYVAGWGLTSADGKVSPVLKSVNVNVIEDDWCSARQDHSPKEMICAGAKGEGGRDACQGDSGGPLLCEIDGRVVLAGVTSWGIGCASAEHPGEWAKVSNYIDWIEERLESGKIKNEISVTSPPKAPTKEYTQSQRLRIRRYCAPQNPNSDLWEYTEINLSMVGKEKFDIYLQKVTECYSKLKEKIMKRVHLAAREEELLDTFGKRQICVRAKQRNQMNSLPCAQKCNQLFADMKVRSPLTPFTKKERQRILFWSRTCKNRAIKEIAAAKSS